MHSRSLSALLIAFALLLSALTTPAAAQGDQRCFFETNQFNGAKKSVGIFDNAERKEEKVVIQSLDDLYGFATRLKATVAAYTSAKA